MRFPLLPRRISPRATWIALVTLGLVALVVLPEAVGASGITTAHRAPTVPSGLDARRALVLRPHRVDLVDGNRVTASVPFDGTNATLAALTAAVGGRGYLTRSGSTVTLTGALVQRPGTSLTAGPDGVRTLHVVSRRGSSAYVWGTGAALTLTGVTVLGDAATPAAVRPYVQYAGGSRVVVRGSTFAHLGRPGRRRLAALDVGSGTRVSVTGSTFADDETGLAAHGSAAVVLQHVSVIRSASDGVTLRDAGVVDVTGLSLVRNRRNGVVVAGTGSRVRNMSDVGASANGHAGLMVTDGAAPLVVRLRTDHDGNAGAVLRGAGRVLLQDVTSTADATGVRVQDGQPALITDLTATGDATGIGVEGRADGLTVRGGLVRGAKVGVRVLTSGVQVAGLSVLQSDIGLESGPTARNLHVTSFSATARVTGTGTGLVAGGPGSVLADVHVTGHRTGLRLEGRGAKVTDSTADVAGSGVLVAGTATGASLTGVSTYGGEEGLRISQGAEGARVADSIVGGGNGARIGAGDAAFSGGSVQARATALVVDSTAGPVTLTGTAVHGTQDGIRMAATAGQLTLDDVQVTGSSRSALELDAGSTEVRGSTLSSTGTTVDAGAQLLVDSSTVTGPVGVHVAPAVTGTLVGTRVEGQNVGVLAAPGSHVTLTASQVYGAVPVRGSATIRDRSFVAAMPLNWLGIAGIALVVIAVLLMLAARARERGRDGVSLAPAHVINRA